MPDDHRPINPYLFIVGAPRSGTTLLQRMVDAHPDIAVFHELGVWLLQWYKQRTGLTPDGTVTLELISHLKEHRKFRRQLQMGRKKIERVLPPLLEDGGEPVSYARFMSGIFDLYGEARGKRLVGDKTPGYALSISMLHSVWPAARLVHLIRDGRDVASSMVNWSEVDRSGAGRFATWDKDPLSTAALWWEWHVRVGREDGELVEQGLYHEVRYESLVSQPAEECAKLCQFLGVPYDDTMLRFHEGRERTDTDLDAKEAWRPVTSSLRDWRSELPAEDVERFEAMAGDLLEELGYGRVAGSPLAEKLEHAAKIRESFAQEVRKLGGWLPERW